MVMLVQLMVRRARHFGLIPKRERGDTNVWLILATEIVCSALHWRLIGATGGICAGQRLVGTRVLACDGVAGPAPAPCCGVDDGSRLLLSPRGASRRARLTCRLTATTNAELKGTGLVCPSGGSALQLG